MPDSDGISKLKSKPYMKKIYLALIAILFSFNSFAQYAHGCDGQRYILDLFPTATKTTIQYATNKNVLGENQKLYMDVYTPDGDTVSQRPVIIWAFGGSFISGGRGDMEAYCRQFAKKGYVCAAIDYRLWPLFTLGFPTGPQVLNVVIQSVSDMRGSVRYFRKDADQGNQFRIDPGNILLGGISAGAITALHAANLDAQDSVPAFIQTAINNNGGIGGNTGDSLMLTYPYDCKAVIDLSGGLYNAKWLDANSPPFVSYQGDADAVVPYTSGIANGLLYIEGSKLLKERSDAIGLADYLVTVPGGGHTDIYTDAKFASYLLEFTVNATIFLENVICGVTATKDVKAFTELKVVPNPAKDKVSIDLPIASNYTIEVFNSLGSEVYKDKLQNDTHYELGRNGLAPGLYVIRFIDEKNSKGYISRLIYE